MLPPSLASLAMAHRLRQQHLAALITRQIRKLWAAVDGTDPQTSWRTVSARAVTLMSLAQAAAALGSHEYVGAALALQGIGSDPAGAIMPQGFAGVAADGRPLASLLSYPAFQVQAFTSQGMAPTDALAVGARHLARITTTEVQDAARTSTGAAITANRAVEGYVRMLTPPSCSRCAILAGVWYSWNAGFERHPLCDCVAIPASEDAAGDLRTSPVAYFDSLDEADQNRIFTNSGAEAIRDGADIGQVVNARRGMYTAGGKSYTSEGDSVRGFHGGFVHEADGTTRRRGADELVKRGGRYRQTTHARLMPEQIYRDAANRNDAIRLLRENGFLSPDTSRHRPLADDFDAAAHDADALAAVPAGLGTRTSGMVATTREQQAAMREYISSFFYAINGQLRRSDIGSAAETIGQLDAAMDLSALRKDVTVWRGIAEAGRLFGDRLGGDLTGMEWTELAYTSTSADRRVADSFTYASGQVLMRIFTPHGVKALRLSGIGDQAEILLQRGLAFRVIADRGIGPDGVRLIDVEVVR